MEKYFPIKEIPVAKLHFNYLPTLLETTKLLLMLSSAKIKKY
jgi:hypothetical protein